jgi:hypothetical protein
VYFATFSQQRELLGRDTEVDELSAPYRRLSMFRPDRASACGQATLPQGALAGEIPMSTFNGGTATLGAKGKRKNRPQVKAEVAPANARQPETVEQFLARGGFVERLDVAACSRTSPQTQREINQITWEQRTAAEGPIKSAVRR